jgi:putative transposase
MPRKARIVLEGIAHHITQRGNYKQKIFEDDEDKKVYLEFISKYAEDYDLKIYAFCLMTNHVHFIGVPEKSDSLAFTFKYAHMRYSQYFNRKHRNNGHLWQGRFFSCPLGEKHLNQAVRYVERNPVRAGIVKYPWDYLWSSAGVHSGVFQEKMLIEYLDEAGQSIARKKEEDILDKTGQSTRTTEQVLGTVPIYPFSIFSFLNDLHELGFNRNAEGWREYLGVPDDEDFMREFKMKTRSGKPFFSQEKIEEINESLDDNQKIVIRKRGRPKKKSD